MKKIFITGINSNLGSDLLPALLNNDYYVYGSYHNINDIEVYKENLKKEVGEKISHLKLLQLDLSDVNSIYTCLKDISDIDVVINNASVRVAGDINDFGISDYERIFQVNVFAVLEIYKYFSEIFKQKGSGDFVNI
jgi:short-subunit dehydrogenase